MISKMQRHLRASTLNRSVLGLIVKRMNGIEIKDAMKHINRIHEFVYSLHEQGTLNLFASEDTRMHVLSLGGISSDFFRAIMHPNVLESNAKAISDFYFQHLSSQTICSIDERIFIGPPDARSMSRNGTNSPKKKRNREEETATEHHANKRHAGNPLPGSNVPSLRSRPLPMSVLHDNWLHGVIHNRPAGPSDQVVRFFTRSSDGGEIIRKKHELTMQIMQSFMYASFRRAGVVEVNNSSSSSSSMAVTSNVRSGIFVSTPKSMHIESSCKQAVQLFWVMVENVLTVESARLSPMSSQKQMKRIGKLLKSDSFHRALLACSVEVVFVANKLYSHLFPQSLATLEVKPLIMFTVIEKFVAACPDLPSAFAHHLQWCNDGLLSQIAWAADGKELFAVLTACSSQLATSEISTSSAAAATAAAAAAVSCTTTTTTQQRPVPMVLTDFFKQVRGLAGRRIYALAKELGVAKHPVLLDHVWSTFLYALTNVWWLFQDRHIDHIIVCCMYGVCKGHGCSLLFHQIIDAHTQLAQQLTSTNTDLLMAMLKSRCNLRVAVSAECATNASDTLRVRPVGFRPSTTSVIGFYNHVFLKRVKVIIMDLYNSIDDGVIATESTAAAAAAAAAGESSASSNTGITVKFPEQYREDSGAAAGSAEAVEQ